MSVLCLPPNFHHPTEHSEKERFVDDLIILLLSTRILNHTWILRQGKKSMAFVAKEMVGKMGLSRRSERTTWTI